MIKNDVSLAYNKETSEFKIIVDIPSKNAVDLFALMLREAKKYPDREGIWYHVTNDGLVASMLFVEKDGILVRHRGETPANGYWFESMDM